LLCHAMLGFALMPADVLWIEEATYSRMQNVAPNLTKGRQPSCSQMLQ